MLLLQKISQFGMKKIFLFYYICFSEPPALVSTAEHDNSGFSVSIESIDKSYVYGVIPFDNRIHFKMTI